MSEPGNKMEPSVDTDIFRSTVREAAKSTSVVGSAQARLTIYLAAQEAGNDRHPTRGIRDHRMRVLTRGHAGAHTDTESLQYGERVSVCEFCENLVEDACIRPFAADINTTGART